MKIYFLDNGSRMVLEGGMKRWLWVGVGVGVGVALWAGLSFYMIKRALK